MQPKVTIVIPVYNGADYLAQAIESALAQTYENVEVLVVNDGSTDDGATQRVAESYLPSIRLISKANGGVASALNLAVQEMKGDYFSWLSHDDLYAPSKVSTQMNLLDALSVSERGNSIIYSDYSVFSDKPDTGTTVSIGGVGTDEFRYWLTLKNQLHGCTLLVPRQAFEECGLFNEELRTTQDFDLWFRMARTYRFRHIPMTLVLARSHANQGSNKMASMAKEECNSLMLHFVSNLSEEELTAKGKRTIADAYTELAASFWHRGFDLAAKATFARARKVWRKEDPKTVIRNTTKMMSAIAAKNLLSILRVFISPQIRIKIRTLLKAASPKENTPEKLTEIPMKDRFSRIYDHNIFGGRLSRSGEGSDLAQTATIQREIPAVLKQIGARSLLDAPCGDWFWMQHVELGVERYIGADIVPDLIARNQQRYGGYKRDFQCLDLTEDPLPKAEVILSRDCLVHLSLSDAIRMLTNFKNSGSTYLLTTTFTDTSCNYELVGKHKFWRPLNLQLEPFNFPKPILIINEGCTEERGRYSSKSLGLWRLENIL